MKKKEKALKAHRDECVVAYREFMIKCGAEKKKWTKNGKVDYDAWEREDPKGFIAYGLAEVNGFNYIDMLEEEMKTEKEEDEKQDCFVEEARVEVAPHVFSKPFYELELWSRPSKDGELKCEGRIYSETYKRAMDLIDELYDHFSDIDVNLEVVYVRQKAYCILRKDNECLKEWKFVHGILKDFVSYNNYGNDNIEAVGNVLLVKNSEMHSDGEVFDLFLTRGVLDGICPNWPDRCKGDDVFGTMDYSWLEQFKFIKLSDGKLLNISGYQIIPETDDNGCAKIYSFSDQWSDTPCLVAFETEICD